MPCPVDTLEFFSDSTRIAYDNDGYEGLGDTVF